MPQITKPDCLDTQRETIRLSLDTLTNDIGMALRDAGLTFPVYLVVPNSGDAIATVATPLDDMREEDWSRVMEIVCRVIQAKTGSEKLHGRALVCTAINTTFVCADVASG